MASQRSSAEIERELAEARQRLTDNISLLVTEVHPRAVASRTVEEGKHRITQSLDRGKRLIAETTTDVKDQFEMQFRDSQGWRWRRVAVAGGIIVGVIVVGVALGSRKK